MVKLNEKINIRIKDRWYDHVIKTLENGKLKTDIKYALWSAVLGSGNINVYIVTNPKKVIQYGEQTLFIKKTDPRSLLIPDRNKLEDMAKDLKIEIYNQEEVEKDGKFKKEKVPKSNLALWTDIMAKDEKNPMFFELDTAIPPEEFDIWINKVEQHDIDKMIDMHLSDGLEVDNRLLYVAKALIPEFDHGLSPDKVMPYNPHGLIFTNSKVGKSTMISRVSIKYDRAKITRLFGFSTADDISSGDLNGLNYPISLDEIQEEKDEGIFNQILSFEETGMARIGVGKETIVCKGTSSIYYMGNPISVLGGKYVGFESIDSSLLLKFDNMLKKLTNNFNAFGSRKAFVLFGKDFKEVSGNAIDEVILDEYSALVQEIRERLKNKVNVLMNTQKIKEWLNMEMDDNYKLGINNMSAKLEMSNPSMEFWRGHCSAYRHIRGFAFREAIIHNIKDILTFDESNPCFFMDEFIEDCEDHLTYVKLLNLNSLSNMISSQDEGVMFQYMVDRIKYIKQDYIKHFIEGICAYVKFKGDKDKDFPHFPISPDFCTEVEKYYNEKMMVQGTYEYWSKIMDKIKKNKRSKEYIENILNNNINITINNNFTGSIVDIKYINIYNIYNISKLLIKN